MPNYIPSGNQSWLAGKPLHELDEEVIDLVEPALVMPPATFKG